MIITLLSDFGTADYFVAAMKGVILSRQPRALLVDLTHEIPPQDIAAAAFTLLAVYRSFPPGTIHVAVVDPGVGSARRPLLVAAGGQFFVGPDNGLFGYIYEREPDATVFHLNDERLFEPAVSATFHGRDVFAPVAAELSTGAAPARFGTPVSDYVRREIPPLGRSADGRLRASVIHLDRFGNCVTNLTRAEIGEGAPASLVILAGGREIRHLRRFYAEGTEGEVFAIWGSAGFLELSMKNGSAARLLGLDRGDELELTLT